MITGKISRFWIIVVMAVIACGCAAFPQRPSDGTQGPGDGAGRAEKLAALRPSAERYRSLAIACEKERQLYKAAFLWMVVRDILPDDRQASRKIEELEETIRRGANQHVLKGGDHVRQKAPVYARNEYLKALAYDANRRDAIEWLRRHPEDEGYTIYETKPGDTAKTIAQKIYGDAGKDFVVVAFDGARHDDSLKPGTMLKLPRIDIPAPPPEFRQRPKNKHKTAYLQDAPRMEKGVDKAGAEDHYRKGVSFFLAEDVKRAIREWEETLKLDPEHPNARRNIEKARKLLKNGRGK